MKTIGVIATMEEEMIAIKRKVVVGKKEEKAGMQFIKAHHEETQVILVKSGIGQVGAAVCAQILVDDFGVDGIMSVGVGAGLHPDMKIGDLVVASDVEDTEADLKVFGSESKTYLPTREAFLKANAQWVQHVLKGATPMFETGRCFIGKMPSENPFEATMAVKGKTDSVFVTYTSELEAAAIAHVAYLNAVPFVMLRNVSDVVNPSKEEDFDAFVHLSARNLAKIVHVSL